MRIKHAVSLIIVALMVGVFHSQALAVPALQIRDGERIAIIGNALAERMQHDGYLEARLQARFPGKHLVVRNLGFAGDEITMQDRSQDFGSCEQWLKRIKADTVFAFFGYNESFGGPDKLPAFTQALSDWTNKLMGQSFGDRGKLQLVVFSPIAIESLDNPNLPKPEDRNNHLKAYSAVMAQVCEAAGVQFIDLLTPTLSLPPDKAPRNINGVHLSQAGNRILAEIIDRSLFAHSKDFDTKDELIRQAVLRKNFCWFNRYRTVDGYSIYGGRADLRFVDGQSNRDVLQREMEILDAMTANRDKAIWLAANGKKAEIDDSNLPKPIAVKTNKPGAGPDQSHIYLTADQAITKMTVMPGLVVNTFADEKRFPELVNPAQMSFDPQGRLWVAAWPTYPHWTPGTPMNDKLLVLEDTDQDGKADRCTTFADDLHNPTGFEHYNGGVIVAMVPDLLFLKDTNGDGKSDLRVRLLGGLDSADTHHSANSFVFDPGGALYFQEGTFHHTQIENIHGPPVRNQNAGVYRYEPLTQKVETYVAFNFANPHGHVFDRWGRDIVIDGTSATPYLGASFSGRTIFPQKHPQPPILVKPQSRPCPGAAILSSAHFPESMQGELLALNVITMQGILRYRLSEHGSGLAGEPLEPMLMSSDPNFRPSDIRIGPDGAIYFTDWQNAIIGHMQHNLRDPSRDRKHGRVYRITVKDRPLTPGAPIAGEPVSNLLKLLKSNEDHVRYRAKIELSARAADEVMAELDDWIKALDPSDPQIAHRLTEALWVRQWFNRPDEKLLKRQLQSDGPHARAAATRVLCYWRDRIPNALDLLKPLAIDQSPVVRPEAVRAASFFDTPAATEIALESVNLPQDPFLKYALDETMKTLETVEAKR